MKYVYYVCAGLCGLLLICSVLSMTGVIGITLGIRDAVIGALGTAVGLYLGHQIKMDEKKDGPNIGRLR